MRIAPSSFSLVIALGAAAAFTTAQDRARTIGSTDPGWTIDGAVVVEKHLGRDALRFGTGSAYVRDARFRDGTVEFDVEAANLRSFVGVRFRAESPEVWEEIYFRPHKSGMPDTVQYAPAFSGARSNWQLYHGPDASAETEMSPGEWLRVRVVVEDRRAALFVGGAATPLLIANLKHEPREGFIGFGALDASAQRGKGHPMAISNVVVRPGVTDFTFPPEQPPTIPNGVVAEWQVSSGFDAPASGPILALPADVVAGEWRPATAEPDGLIPLDRFVTRAAARRAAALARVTIAADRERTVPFTFGFSDDASVFLNGRLLYSGVNGYSHNFPRREGLITIDQAMLYLPLQQGDNELVLAISDSFGGAGVMAALPDRTGITVR